MLTIEKVLKQFMKGHFSSVKGDLQENNNSFIFLEKSSLNLLLAYLLTNGKNETPYSIDEEMELQTMENLNRIIQNNEQEFKSIINILKEIT